MSKLTENIARIFQWLAGGLILLLLYKIRAQLWPALAPFLYAILLAYLLAPLVELLEKRKLPRTVAISLVYLGLVMGIFLLGFYGLPSIYTQVNSLLKQLPDLTARGQLWLDQLGKQYAQINLPPFLLESIETSLLRWQDALDAFLDFIMDFTISFFSSAVTVVLVPILSFYMLKDLEAIKQTALNLFPEQYRHTVLKLIGRVDAKLGAWVRGQLIVGLATGGLIFVGLKLVDMDYALVLGMLVALLNFIPYFGPVIAAIPSILLGFLRAPVLGLKVLVVQVVVQHFESTVLVPQILGRELGIHPLLLIFALMLGAQLAGILGMVLAAPIVAIILDLWSLWQQQDYRISC
ncbi:MAG: AI-2E family transporter [Firmicutes bacterium]|nr:AI-2E family transporter [Bacillota bacterium]